MIALPAGVKVWLVAGATDMRNYAEPSVMRSCRCRACSLQDIPSTTTVHNNAACPCESASEARAVYRERGSARA
jgi:hypothetical protein